MNLSPHFTLEEMTRSSTASRLRIANVPGDSAIAALSDLCQSLLEPLRERAGRPLVVTSGFRSPALNTAVGGAPRSFHLYGKAADIRVAGKEELRKLAKMAASLPACDAAIMEQKNGAVWLHVQIDKKPRHFVISIGM